MYKRQTCANVLAFNEVADEVVMLDVKEGVSEGKAMEMCIRDSHNPLYIWLMILSQVKIIGDCPCLVIHSIDRIKTGFLSCILRCLT